MDKQIERDKRIFSKLNIEKLPYKITYNHFKDLGHTISCFTHNINNLKNKSKGLGWCFSNVKRIKIFFLIFHANESGSQIYKEEIAKNISEYSYKTIAKIIDEGLSKGYYIPLEPHGKPSSDGKVKNIRPSEELITDFLNAAIQVFRSLHALISKNKSTD